MLRRRVVGRGSINSRVGRLHCLICLPVAVPVLWGTAGSKREDRR